MWNSVASDVDLFIANRNKRTQLNKKVFWTTYNVIYFQFSQLYIGKAELEGFHEHFPESLLTSKA
jgi:hypothetical protein